MMIYKIQCKTNGKVYIGQSVKPYQRRIGQHLSALRLKKHSNQHMQSSWNKYGEESFSFEKLEDVAAISDLDSRERYFIQLHDSTNRTKGFNVESGGNFRKTFDSPLRGIKKSAEHIEKLKQAKRGKSYSRQSFQNAPKVKVEAVNIISGLSVCFLTYRACAEFIGCSFSAVRCHIIRKTNPIKKTWQVTPVIGGSY